MRWERPRDQDPEIPFNSPAHRPCTGVSMKVEDTILELLLWPGFWWGMLVLWLVIWIRGIQKPPVSKKFHKPTAKTGDLFADGSTATSKLEARIRWTIKKSGYRVYPPSTRIYTPPDHNGKRHKYTPDIILRKPKLIVEVDPLFTHRGEDKVNDDIARNRMYARMGYTVVRIRIGGARALSPNDVVILEGDYDIEKHGRMIIAGIRKARPLPARFWDNPYGYLGQLPKSSKRILARDRVVSKARESVEKGRSRKSG